MAKLWHSADGSLHLLQPAMQLMAALMTKAVGVAAQEISSVCSNAWGYETTFFSRAKSSVLYIVLVL